LPKSYPDITFSWAMGADTYLDLVDGKWRRPDEVARAIGGRFHVFTRGKGETKDKVSATVAEQNAKADAARAAPKGSAERRAVAFGGTLHELPGMDEPGMPNVSSTHVRSFVWEIVPEGPVEEDSPLRSAALVDPQVLGYLRWKGLYAEGWEPPAEEQERTHAAPNELKRGEGEAWGWGSWACLLAPLVLMAVLGVMGIVAPPSFFEGLFGGGGNAVQLTTDNFAELTEGKAVFMKMYAPW